MTFSRERVVPGARGLFALGSVMKCLRPAEKSLNMLVIDTGGTGQIQVTVPRRLELGPDVPQFGLELRLGVDMINARFLESRRNSSNAATRVRS